MAHETSFDHDDLLFSEQFGDHYYSRHDGRAECAHVFLGGNGLPQRWTSYGSFTVGELGFGTGLNFLETWNTWRRERGPEQHLTFVSLEAFPLCVNTTRRALENWPDLGNLSSRLLDRWHDLSNAVEMDSQTSLHVLHGKADDMLPRFPEVDAWFLDGFAPAKNPDMWSAGLMQMLGEHTVPGGTCASYTAAGWVRRNLEAAGFKMEKRPGFGTKRDMIAGLKS